MEKRNELNPPSEAEFNHALARRIFGKHAGKMKRALWSFLLIKILWKNGEQPWEE